MGSRASAGRRRRRHREGRPPSPLQYKIPTVGLHLDRYLPRALPAAPDALPLGDTAARSYADVVCGAYRLDKGQAHPFLRELPDVIHMRSGRHPAMRALVGLLADRPESGSGADAAVPALIDLLLVHLLRAWHDDAGPPAAPSGVVTQT